MCMVDRSDATVKDIYISMQLGCGHPFRPLHFADYIGLDTSYYIIELYHWWMDEEVSKTIFTEAWNWHFITIFKEHIFQQNDAVFFLNHTTVFLMSLLL
jgi:hypothetical protein